MRTTQATVDSTESLMLARTAQPTTTASTNTMRLPAPITQAAVACTAADGWLSAQAPPMPFNSTATARNRFE